jgi:phosphatidylglycerol---prolipoprotein diacylglyceryl transferase
MLYLILSGTSRLLVEFIRLNPRLLFGLSEAQLISIVLIISGIIGFVYFTRGKNLRRFVPLLYKESKSGSREKIKSKQ